MRVTLDILSGIANPSWVVAKNVAEDCCRRVQALPVLRLTHDELPSSLGYRGLLLGGGDVRRVLGADEVSVGEGRVLLLRAGRVFAERKDAGRAIEALLLASADSAVDAELLAEARRSLPGK